MTVSAILSYDKHEEKKKEKKREKWVRATHERNKIIYR